MEQTVSSHFGCKQPPAKGRKTNSGLLIGVEIELEQIALKRQPVGWNTVQDGSLKNKGLEFTLPVWHTNLEEWLQELFSCFSEVETSPRCSVHIHANVTDFTLDQIKALILLYTVFERALYRFSGKRWNSIYCVPVQTWAVGVNLNILSFNDLQEIFPKYSGLNLFPYDEKNRKTLGTVEFRHMTGSKNILYIKTWAEIVANLVKYAHTKTYAEVKEKLKDLRHTSQYWELFQEIFKDKAQVLNYSDFDKDIEVGITFAKLISTD